MLLQAFPLGRAESCAGDGGGGGKGEEGREQVIPSSPIPLPSHSFSLAPFLLPKKNIAWNERERLQCREAWSFTKSHTNLSYLSLDPNCKNQH